MTNTSSPAVELDQPLTPAGRLFSQHKMEQVINAIIAGDHPLNIPAIRSEIESSFLLNHPRFSSILVRDSLGREHWRKTKVNLDRHLIIHRDPLPGDDPVNEYLADLTVYSPLPTDKPLWEFHLLMAHDIAVLRVHHSLGDGISFMSFFLSCCRRVDDPSKTPDIGGVGARRLEVGRRNWLWLVWYTLVYVMEFVFRALWKRDEMTSVSGGAGVEMWPRRMATARFRIDDIKIVKAAVTDATINDVLFGIISSGLSRYLEIRSFEDQTQAPREGLQLTGLAMVNLRPQTGLQDMSKLMNDKSGTQWGNKFGMIMLPVYYHKHNSDPIQFVKRAKAMIDKKKLSLEAPCTYKIGDLVVSLLGAKLASMINYRIFCNTTFSISNIMGPREKITFAGIPVKHIRATATSLPHAITMHMVSYAGYADMQILTAKEVVPDPKILAKCLEDSLLEMKEAVQAAKKMKRGNKSKCL